MTQLDTPTDPRCFAPATQRNREPILDVLSRTLPTRGVILEVGSGTGEHAAWFAHNLRPLIWQPSDPDPAMRSSIFGHGQGIATLKDPLDLDVTQRPWPIQSAAGIVCINMIHIAPWDACEGLIAGAAEVLPSGGVLFLYGPFKRSGAHTAASNAAFDQSLRARDPSWGVRDLETVCDLAQQQGLACTQTIEMPANNLSVIFTRQGD